MASGSRPWQRGGAVKHWDQVAGDLGAVLALPPRSWLLTLISFSVNKGSSTGDDLCLIPTLAPAMALGQ